MQRGDAGMAERRQPTVDANEDELISGVFDGGRLEAGKRRVEAVGVVGTDCVGAGRSVVAGSNVKPKQRWQRDFKKDATCIVDVNIPTDVSALDVINAVNQALGVGKLLAVRPRAGKEFEITVEGEELCEKLMDGLMVKEVLCDIRKLCSSELMVSFLHLPAYIEDDQILEKLLKWGVTPILPVRRRFYPGTTVADGTRFLCVRFPAEVSSLPYSVKLDTAEGPQYFRVLHDKQVRLCRLCMSAEHLMRDCPTFVCRECYEHGHFVRNCKAVRCEECRHALISCTCSNDEDSTVGMLGASPSLEVEVSREPDQGQSTVLEPGHEQSTVSGPEHGPVREQEPELSFTGAVAAVPDEEGEEIMDVSDQRQCVVLEPVCEPALDQGSKLPHSGGTAAVDITDEEHRAVRDRASEKRARDCDTVFSREDAALTLPVGAVVMKQRRKVKPQPNLVEALERQRSRREVRKERRRTLSGAATSDEPVDFVG